VPRARRDPARRAAAGTSLEGPLPAAWLDPAFRLAWANEAFARLVGADSPSEAAASLEALSPGSGARLSEAARGLEPGGEASLEPPGAGPARFSLLRPPGGDPQGGGVLVLGWPEGVGAAAAAGARERADRAAERLYGLQEITSALSTFAAESQVEDAAFRVGLSVLAASGGSIFFPGPDGALRVAHSYGAMTRRGGAPATQSGSVLLPVHEAFATGKPVFISSASELERRYPGARGTGAVLSDASFVAVPLLVGERMLGVLGLGFAAARDFQEEERGFIVAVAHQCAQAIERARLYEAERSLVARLERAAAERDELVAQLRHTLEERDATAALLDALFDNAPVGVALLDPEMRYVRANAHLAALHGVRPGEHLGRGMWEVTPLLVREELERDIATVVAERKPILERPVTTQLLDPTEPSRSFLLSFFPVAAGARLTAVGVLWREVTVQRRAEQLQRHLLGVVGHDLRSPLMAITASAELIQSSIPGEREQRSLGRILRAAQRIDGIIRALVDYTLVHVGSGIPLQRRRTELGAIARGVAEEAETVHAGRRVKVSVPESIAGDWDPDRVGQALANLVGNALDYSPAESAVEVACRAERGEGVVEVRNEGAPIAPELIPCLFEPFRRGSEERVQRRKGLGLGLYIARQIVLAHGGAIEVRSAEGSGTTFTLRLPRAAVEAGAASGGGLA